MQTIVNLCELTTFSVYKIFDSKKKPRKKVRSMTLPPKRFLEITVRLCRAALSRRGCVIMILIVPCSDIFRLAVTMLQLMCNTPSIRRQVKHQFHNTLKSFLKVLTEGVTSYLTEKYFLTFFLLQRLLAFQVLTQC